VLDLLCTDFGRPATEPAIDGNQILGQSEVAHYLILVGIHNP
jgi:hypothetical protein